MKIKGNVQKDCLGKKKDKKQSGERVTSKGTQTRYHKRMHTEGDQSQSPPDTVSKIPRSSDQAQCPPDTASSK